MKLLRLNLAKNDWRACVESPGAPWAYCARGRVCPEWKVLRDDVLRGKACCRVAAGEALVRLQKPCPLTLIKTEKRWKDKQNTTNEKSSQSQSGLKMLRTTTPSQATNSEHPHLPRAQGVVSIGNGGFGGCATADRRRLDVALSDSDRCRPTSGCAAVAVCFGAACG